MVSVKSLTAPKSVGAVAVSPSTETVTDVAVVSAAPSRVPVTLTVVSPAPSATVGGFSDRMTLAGIASFSVIVRVAGSTFSPSVLPLTVTVSGPS